MRWTVEVTAAAERELRDLAPDIQASFQHVAELLRDFGPHRVGMPHVRHLDGKLWEMRLRGRDGIARAIYFAAAGQRLIVLRVFVKKTQQTPYRELQLAARRMKEFDDE
jgi:phage-related protein